MLGSVLFLMMQIIALISLILSIAIPLCSKQSDCDQDNGWVCVSTQEGKSRSFCVDCRVPTCSNNPDVPFNISAVKADGMLASDYCEANIDSFLYEGEGCYLLKSALSTMTTGAPSPNSTPTHHPPITPNTHGNALTTLYHAASWLVVLLVTMGLGLSLMMEKRQALLHNRLLRVGLGIRSDDSCLSCLCCCVYCCMGGDTTEATNEDDVNTQSDGDGGVSGVSGLMGGLALFHIDRDGQLRQQSRSALDESFRAASTATGLSECDSAAAFDAEAGKGHHVTNGMMSILFRRRMHK